MSDQLTLDDILDSRAYERVRDDYRRQMIALKQRRRVPLGPIATVVFECAETVRFQVQEMARAERIVTDEGILAELAVYNRLLPRLGELSATLFLELTSPEELRRWLPALVGIEQALLVEMRGTDAVSQAIWGVPEADHVAALTRDEITAAVHYVRFPFTDADVARFAAAPVALAVDHSEYQARTALSEDTLRELLGDLRGETSVADLGR